MIRYHRDYKLCMTGHLEKMGLEVDETWKVKAARADMKKYCHGTSSPDYCVINGKDKNDNVPDGSIEFRESYKLLDNACRVFCNCPGPEEYVLAPFKLCGRRCKRFIWYLFLLIAMIAGIRMNEKSNAVLNTFLKKIQRTKGFKQVVEGLKKLEALKKGRNLNGSQKYKEKGALNVKTRKNKF